MQYSLSPSYKGFETQRGIVSSNKVKNKFILLTGMDFGSNPNQANNISKKKDHCLRNTYDIKICKLYHNIVKKQGEYHWGLQQP